MATSNEALQDTEPATTTEGEANTALELLYLIRDLRQLAIGLHHAAAEPFHWSEEESHAELIEWHAHHGRRAGLQLAASRLERVLEPYSAQAPS